MTEKILRQLVCAWLFLGFASAVQSKADIPDTFDQQTFRKDVRRLCKRPHRVAGTESAQEAAEFIRGRLGEIGIEEIYTLDVPVWYTEPAECKMELGDSTIELQPLRPNLGVPPTTPPGGLSGPLLYAGSGELSAYGEKTVEGSLVLLDYTSASGAWRKAFAMGADAVIFVGGEAPTESAPYVPVPVNLPRFYVNREDLQGLDLSRTGKVVDQEARVISRVPWRNRPSSNIIVRIKGSDPQGVSRAGRPETIVLSSHYDSYGVVPQRSRGVFSAANTAALLQTAAYLKENPPKRNIVLMFLTGHARNRKGARATYSALTMPQNTSHKLIEQHKAEIDALRTMRKLLEEEGLRFELKGEEAGWLQTRLQREAKFIRDKVFTELGEFRLSSLKAEGERKKELDRRAEKLNNKKLAWDDVRRSFHSGRFQEFVKNQTDYSESNFTTDESGEWTSEKKKEKSRKAKNLYIPLFEQLKSEAKERITKRINELEFEQKRDEQRTVLRKKLLNRESEGGELSDKGFMLHVAFSLSNGPQWGFVAGNDRPRMLDMTPKAGSDSPGLYEGVLKQLDETLNELGAESCPTLSRRTVQQTRYGQTFVPGPVMPDSSIAGLHGIYNLAIMTGHTANRREGQPEVDVDSVELNSIFRKAGEAAMLLNRAAQRKGFSLPRVIAEVTRNKYTGWKNGKSWGSFALHRVTGGLAERRPASGALVAYWPSTGATGPQFWRDLENIKGLPGFAPWSFSAANASGRFRITDLRKDLGSSLGLAGMMFDEDGRVTNITTQETLTQNPTATIRINLMEAESATIMLHPVWSTRSANLKVMEGNNTLLMPNEGLYGKCNSVIFSYFEKRRINRLKMFLPMGFCALGEFTEDSMLGKGVAVSDLQTMPWASRITSRDLWKLDESRLTTLRDKGVRRSDLEKLGGAALSLKTRVKEVDSTDKKESLQNQSSILSGRLAGPLRKSLTDPVNALVILLVLSVPFSFFMERIVICATSIYGRITGFIIMFMITFGMLYVLHPGFAIANTPMIIFLAFAIIVITSLVIVMLVRRLESELKVLQGQGVRRHEAEISRSATFMAAVSMGMSTMRRRPTRTLLSTVTVLILTFTILCFASFTKRIDVRRSYLGAAGEDMPAAVTVHNTDYTELPSSLGDMLSENVGKGGAIAPQAWLVRKNTDDPRFDIAEPESGRAATAQAIMGITPRELSHWPALSRALGSGQVAEMQQALKNDAVFLPPHYKHDLGVEKGDPVLVQGRSMQVGGFIKIGEMGRLKNVDRRSIIPVNYTQSEALKEMIQEGGEDEAASGLEVKAEVNRTFTRLSSRQVVVVSQKNVESMGGTANIINLYPGEEQQLIPLAEKVAQLVKSPVWVAGSEGLERLMLGWVTEVSGGAAILVPLFLGGLIIFGTLLGSINDREKEIYTFSALGLGPGHVGMLFFAEAAVYAVVGGVGGQLIAQMVAHAAAKLAEMGLIEPLTLNFSSMNSLFAMAVVMAVVLISAVYPAIRASRSANPGLARSWRLPAPDGDDLRLAFPFTVSAYDITGVVSFLREHFESHDDPGLGQFAASNTQIRYNESGFLEISCDMALAPFDMGVTQHFRLSAKPSEIENINEVIIHATRKSGSPNDWIRCNREFLKDLRVQFIIWRTLKDDVMEDYRLQTLQALGEAQTPGNEPSQGTGQAEQAV